jgi:hypothetical protein
MPTLLQKKENGVTYYVGHNGKKADWFTIRELLAKEEKTGVTVKLYEFDAEEAANYVKKANDVGRGVVTFKAITEQEAVKEFNP